MYVLARLSPQLHPAPPHPVDAVDRTDNSADEETAGAVFATLFATQVNIVDYVEFLSVGVATVSPTSGAASVAEVSVAATPGNSTELETATGRPANANVQVMVHGVSGETAAHASLIDTPVTSHHLRYGQLALMTDPLTTTFTTVDHSPDSDTASLRLSSPAELTDFDALVASEIELPIMTPLEQVPEQSQAEETDRRNRLSPQANERVSRALTPAGSAQDRDQSDRWYPSEKQVIRSGSVPTVRVDRALREIVSTIRDSNSTTASPRVDSPLILERLPTADAQLVFVDQPLTTAVVPESAVTSRQLTTQTAVAEVPMQVMNIAQGLAPGITQQVVIRLDPPELGRVMVRIRRDRDTVTIEMTAESSDVAASLRSQEKLLVDRLVEQGFEQSDIELSFHEQHQPHDPESESGARHVTGKHVVARTRAPTLPLPPVAVASMERLNFTA